MTDHTPKFIPSHRIRLNPTEPGALAIRVTIFDNQGIVSARQTFRAVTIEVPGSDGCVFDIRFADGETVFVSNIIARTNRPLTRVGFEVICAATETTSPMTAYPTNIAALRPDEIIPDGFDPGIWVTAPPHIGRIARPDALAKFPEFTVPGTDQRPTPTAAKAQHFCLGSLTRTNDDDIVATCHQCKTPVYFDVAGITDLPLLDLTTRSICDRCLKSSPGPRVLSISKGVLRKLQGLMNLDEQQVMSFVLSKAAEEFPGADVQIVDDPLTMEIH